MNKIEQAVHNLWDCPENWERQETEQTVLQVKISEDNDNNRIHVPKNRDFYNVPSLRGCFSKALPHNEKGNTSKNNYMKLVKGALACCPKQIENVQLGTPEGLKLISPSAIFDYNLSSQNKSTYKLKVTPEFLSERNCAEMIEVYEMALTRDIPFCDYQNNEQIAIAAKNISAIKCFNGPRIDGQVTPGTIFRTSTTLNGPYVSQMLLYPVPYGVGSFDQIYPAPAEGKDYNFNIDLFKKLHSGQVTETVVPSEIKRYITTMRDGAGYVHVDLPIQPYFNAFLILCGLKVPYGFKSPYNDGTLKNQKSFVSLDKIDFFELLGHGSRLVFDTAWFHKWTNLKARPEEMAYQIHRHLVNDEKLDFPESLLNSDTLKRIYQKNSDSGSPSYLLSQVYIEGCPTHPSYPAGHATIAGFGATLLNAWFQNDYILPYTYQPDKTGQNLIDTGIKVSVWEEVVKLATNISTFRNGAGVHYRADMRGMMLGEAVAIDMLKTIVKRYHYNVSFNFKGLDGRAISIGNDCEC